MSLGFISIRLGRVSVLLWHRHPGQRLAAAQDVLDASNAPSALGVGDMAFSEAARRKLRNKKFTK